jgi:TRAP-type transport system periplasmic protein
MFQAERLVEPNHTKEEHMKKMCLVFLAGLLIFPMLQLSAQGGKDAKVIKLNTGVSDGDPAVIAMREIFKPIVEKATSGSYVVEVYHSGQLGSDVNAIESVRSGTLEMNFNGTAALAGMVKELTLLDIPFAFKNSVVMVKVLNGSIGNMLKSKLAEKGIVVLGWTDNGYRHLTNSRGSVNVPADVSGLKIRTQQNKFHMSAWQALGASPTPMAITEVFTALQTKTIDGQENPLPTIYKSKFYEVNKYISLTGHINTPCGLFFSKKVFDGLPANIQQILRNAGEETARKHLELVEEATKTSIQSIKAAGGIINEISPANIKLFQNATAKVWNEVGDGVGAQLVEQFKTEIAKAE